MARYFGFANRSALLLVTLLAMAGIVAGSLSAQAPPMSQPPPLPGPIQPAPAPALQRFQFKIDANTPVKDLMPVAPRIQRTGPLDTRDLARVPEVEFQAPLAKDLASEKALQETAHMIAKVNHFNDKKVDGFLEALRGERPDLQGLPFVMGDACRTKGERNRQFAIEAARVREAFSASKQRGSRPPSTASTSDRPHQVFPKVFKGDAIGERASHFWENYLDSCLETDRQISQADRVEREHVTVARAAALMQVLAPESAGVRLGLVKYLSTIAHVEATRSLARLAVFSSEDEVRLAAVDALKVRRERDYTEILLRGLRYPWPDVARRAADALVRLERTDLMPQLLDLLDEPDPRSPVVQEIDRKKVPVVRELVRINHQRGCLLCHAPGNTGTVAPETLTADVPNPREPLPAPSDGYRSSSPDVLVRVDVTYLRQDFSTYQAVADAAPWPEMQRFDFLVRTRVLTEAESVAWREKFTQQEPGRLSPYHRAALAALRELTGKDTEPTAAAWRRLLAPQGKPMP